MRLMRESEVPTTPRGRVYRASRLYAVLFAAAALALSAALILPRGARHTPMPAFGAFVFLALLVVRRFITARFHPSNWLVRRDDQGMFIHFRSYLNDGMSADDATVVFLGFGEIRSARLVRERLRTPDPETANAYTTQTVRWVELELAIDPAPLVDALATECERPGSPVKRWFGKSTTLYRDYPVLMQTPPFLRVKWQAVPRAKVFLAALQPYVEIAAPVRISEDCASLQGLTREQQEQRLRQLNQRGNTIDAVYMARRLYGLDLTQATKFVKELSGVSHD